MIGAQLKQDYNKVLEAWLEDPDHLNQWENQSISAGNRRILITLWLAEAAERFRGRGLAKCVSSWERTGCGMSADGSGDEKIVVSGIPNYTFVQPVDVELDDVVGLDEADAKRADPEEPPQSKFEENAVGEDLKELEEEEEEDEEDEEDQESKSDSEQGEPVYWVQCEIEKCQKWRKIPTAWSPNEDFICELIRVRCAQQCDACKGLRCSSECVPE